MEVRLLGSVEVWVGGRRIEVGPPQRRAVLAALAVDAGQPVPAPTLVDRVWGAAAPERVRAALYAHMTLIRRIVAAGNAAGPDEPAVQLVHDTGGYALRLDPQRVDLHRFRRLVVAGRDRAGRDAERAASLRQALDLWRGPALNGLSGAWLDRMRVSWELERLDATVEWARAELALGHHSTVIDAMRTVSAEQPIAEPPVAVLMRALMLAGRMSEALDCYAKIRQRLVEELGADPGAELQELHQEILRGGAPTSATAPARRRPARPAQLPLDVHGFTGRSGELAQLDAVLATAAEQPTGTAIVVLSGSAGAGKTALAVHWAHRVRERFPDGQLHVDLRGYAAAPALRPIDALARFLSVLGVPAEQVPMAQDDVAAEYRSALAGRRMLVVLDDARDAEQVRPLLPGVSGCLVLVTSRQRLSGLVARDGAYPLAVGVLSAEESGRLLTRIVGADRVRAEQRAAAELAAICGHLPLALRIAAAQLLDDPHRPLARYVAALADGDVIDALRLDDDDRSAVRVAFDASYARLDAEARMVFRRLSLVPGADFTAAAAGALTGLDGIRAGRLLDRLRRAHLIDERQPDRYGFHDLLRRYANERAVVEDGDAALAAATERLYDRYVEDARAAAALLYPAMLRLPGPPGDPDRFGTAATALAWLDAEAPNLVAVVRQAADQGPHRCAWLLSDAMRGYFRHRGNTVDWLICATAARVAAEAAGDLTAQAAAELSLGLVAFYLARYQDCVEHTAEAGTLASAAGWPAGEAAAVGNLGMAYDELGQPGRAAEHYRQALALNRQLGQRSAAANALGNLGLVYTRSGDLAQAAESYSAAMELHREVGNVRYDALSLGNLGEVALLRGETDAALDYVTRALELFRDLGGSDAEALTVQHTLAAIHREAGRHDAALEQVRTALEVVAELGGGYAAAALLTTRASIHLARGEPAEAVRHSADALQLARERGHLYDQTEALIALACGCRDLGDLPAATRHATEALMLTRSRFRLLEGLALGTLAGILLAAGRPTEAAERARQAIAVHRETGHRPGEARAVATLTQAQAQAQAGHRGMARNGPPVRK